MLLLFPTAPALPVPPKSRASKSSKKKPASSKKRSPARKRSAAPKKGGTARKKRGVPSRLTWRQRLFREALTVFVGVSLGLGVTGWWLWHRARADVEQWLERPPATTPAVVWSAPMEVRSGQQVSVSSLAADLIAAGYDRAGAVVERGDVGSFAMSGEGLKVWTRDGLSPRPGHATVTVSEGKVVSTSPSRGVVFAPTVLATLGDPDARRQRLDLDAFSEWVEPALLAMEDSRFREHHGVDPLGVVRALARNAIVGGGVQGGSTLTQQLAKNLFLSPDRSLRRKVREVFFAAALEAELSKDALLELYLSEVYLGQMGGLPLYGVEAASRAWFGVSADQLQLHQAATIIGVIPAPNAYSPVRHAGRSQVRRDLVLSKMQADGAITPAQAEQAKAVPLALTGIAPSRVRRAPYAVDAAIDAAERSLGEGVLASNGWAVHTTIQPVLQRAAEQAVAEGMSALDAAYPKAAGAQVALVAIDPRDGSVVALVGGRSYATSPFNRATDAWRQAGSTVKPLTLLAALDSGDVTPASRLEDSQLVRRFDGTTWTPANYDGRFLGEVSIRQAIEGSRNIPAIHLAELVGASRLERLLERAGLSEATSLPSASLGAFVATPLQLAGAYTAFPAGGVAHAPRLIDRFDTTDGQSLLRIEPASARLASERAAAQATDVLTGVIERGTGASASTWGVRQPAGGKTGTTDGFRDAWFVGFTPDLVVAVWVGRDRGNLGLSGSRAALPTWSRFVAASGTNTGAFPKPEGLVRVEVCEDDGRLPCPGCTSTHDELFLVGTEPTRRCGALTPVRDVGRFLGGLFGRRVEEEPVEDEEAVDPPTKRKRGRKRDR
ncbi:MAG: penicillin-binding protein 1B [Myxococcota bacterium]